LNEEWLPADHGTDNAGLQRRVARGVSWTAVDNWGRQFLGLVVFVVLANLLGPKDFGLVALATVFIAFAQVFVDQGLGDALIQRRQLTRAHIDTAFWVAMVTGGALAAAGMVLAIPIASLFNNPQLQPILQVLSLTFVLTALASVQMALLRRELAFRSLALRGLVAIGGGGLVGILMAFNGYGAWALVGQQLSQSTLSVLALWRVSPWRPGRRVSREHFRELFGFGANVVGSDLLSWVSRYTDNLLIGIFQGEVALGIYGVAYRILDAISSLLVGIARKVAFPGLSRLQHDPERMKRAYIRVSRVAGAMILPGFIGLALVAPELITVVFGAKWTESGPVAAILFLIGPVLALQTFSGSLLQAAGHPEVVFRFRLVTAVVNVIGFAIAVQFGIIAVAVAFVLRGYLLLPLNLLWVRRYSGIPIADYLRAVRGMFIAAAGMAGAVVLIKLLWPLDMAGQRVWLLAAEIAVGTLAFTLIIWLVDRRLLREVIGIVSQALPGGESLAARLGMITTELTPPAELEPIPPDIDMFEDDD
jgi:O-antigen/teichoic acid export membrane protein